MKYILGIVLIIFAIFVIGSTFIPVIQQEINYNVNKISYPTEIKKIVPIDTEFGIVIPKINANAHVIKNIDPYKPEIYEQALTKGVAHALGTSLPGELGNIFLFSHSSSDFLNATKYNSIFYLINKLEKDDQINLFYEGKEYVYSVVSKKIIEPNEINYLYSKDKPETLTLMTCWPPGTSLKRLIVQANRTSK